MEAEHPENQAEEEIAANEAAAAENKQQNSQPVGGESSQPAPETIRMPEEKHRSWFAALLYFLFGADTAVGRIMRPALRWAAFVLILFAAGMLVMYFWRVRPTDNLLRQTAADLAAAQAELTGARTAVTDSQGKVSDMQRRVQTAEAGALTASQHMLLTRLRNDVASARVALAAEKDTAAAILALSNAELDLREFTPAIDKFNATLAAELKDDLAGIQKGLSTRPVNQSGLAEDLFSFDVKLLGLEKLMFPE